MIKDSTKTGRWIIAFKKFSMVRVKKFGRLRVNETAWEIKIIYFKHEIKIYVCMLKHNNHKIISNTILILYKRDNTGCIFYNEVNQMGSKINYISSLTRILYIYLVSLNNNVTSNYQLLQLPMWQ